MLPAPLPAPVPFHFAPSCEPASNTIFTRPRLAVSSTFYQDIAQLDFAPVSPAYSSSTEGTGNGESSTSPRSSQAYSSPNYHYDNCGSNSTSFGSPSSSTEMYDSDPPSAYPTTSSPSNIYHGSVPATNYSIGTVSDIRKSDAPASYPTDSPSPGDVQSSAGFFYSSPEPHSQDQLPSTSPNFRADPDEDLKHPSQLLQGSDSHSFLSNPDTTSYPSQDTNTTDLRRMSEPSIHSSSGFSASSGTNADSASRYPYSASYTSPFRAPHQRGNSLGSVRDLRHHQQLPFSQSRTSGDDPRHMPPDTPFHTGDALESPLSPFQPDFSMRSPTLQYPPTEDPYGPSPPGTGTSSSSNARGPIGVSQTSITSDSPGFPPSDIPEAGTSSSDRRKSNSADPSSRTYSFVALPGNAVRKRPRRRYDEIERLYQCSWPDCNKAYGTLNHLNAHVTMQKHGSKRSPNEFKELRKQWRKAKKEQEAAATAAARRAMLGNPTNEREFYDRHDSHYASPPQRYPFSTPQSLPSLSTTPRGYIGGDNYYSSSMERPNYTAVPVRRYSESGISSWNVPSSHRPSVSHSGYMSTSLPSHSGLAYNYGQDHNVHSMESPSYPSGGSSDRPLSIPTPPQMMTGRLPPNSTLLTPLPGYEPRETLPPMQAGGNMTYDPEAYYGDESVGRSSSAHAGRGRDGGF
ncbi:hypothetical protein VNI00_002965 [Paramarasmius palmivorus]|uniref:C2H2-type domain-containing protein n=1 Tax=Paramarasmius palmivorus TaxID=297713 RepID=A0AAW0DXY4_9AGAR